MAATPDSQLSFLISCIRHSNAGKVDFEEVRKECEIVSKGAAAKRYERLLKAHGISAGAISGVKREAKDPDDNKKAAKRTRASKRKLEEVNEDEDDTDEPPVKEERKVKGEVKYEDAKVKFEHANDVVPATFPYHTSSHSQSISSFPTAPRSSDNLADRDGDGDGDDDDDDEVLFVSSNEKKPRSPDVSTEIGNHRHSETQLSAAGMHGHQSVVYPTNLAFIQQPELSDNSSSPSPSYNPFANMMIMRNHEPCYNWYGNQAGSVSGPRHGMDDG